MNIQFGTWRRVAVAVICCAIVFLWSTMFQLNFKTNLPSPVRVKSNTRPVIALSPETRIATVFKTRLHVPFPSVLRERETLHDEPCTDWDVTISPERSAITLLKTVTTYRIGDMINVRIELRNHKGQIRSSGGEIVKVLLESIDQRSFAPGRVHDYKNGTYMGKVEALWPGRVQLIVRVHVTREEIAATYRVRRQMVATRKLQAKFTHRGTSEVTTCHPNSHHLQRFFKTGVCNFTLLNSGDPWFCGRPVTSNLSCNNWMESREQAANHTNISFTDIETYLIKNPPILYSTTLQIENSTRKILLSNAQTCNTIPRQFLWQQRDPTGFFDRGGWVIRNCRNGSATSLVQRLRNKVLYLFGDSTLRQWLEYAVESDLNCKMIIKAWTRGKWKQKSTCVVKDLNITIGWYPGNYPYYVSPIWQDKSSKFVSAGRLIDSIKDDEDAIVVVHVFMHMTTMLPDVFRTKLQIIKRSIVRLIQRNRQAQIFIKAPHSCSGHDIVTCVFAYEYTNIIHTVFQDIQNQVIYLNNMDITDAIRNTGIHPPECVVEAMFLQMLNYARK